MSRTETCCEVVINEDGTLCGEPQGMVKSRPWCAGHLQRFYRHGDVDGLRPLKGRNKDSTCEVVKPNGDVCGELSAWPNGKYGHYCRPHAEAFKKYGDPLERAEKFDHGDTCELALPDGTTCPNPYDGKIGGVGVGMCTFHLGRTRQWGDPRVDLPINYHLGRNTCIVVLDYEPRRGEVCGLLVNAHGMCSGHYLRDENHGSVQADKPLIPSDIKGDDRFLYRADPANGFIRLGDLYDGTPCHHWLGAKNKRGYGLCGADSQVARSRLVHRRIWETLVGPIPAGFHIDHQCHKRDCLNLEHLRCLPPKEHVRATRLVVEMAAEIEALKKQIAKTK